jgi:hypothetical protein
MHKQGVLKSWHVNGYGIVAVSRKELYFLHTNNVIEGPDELEIGSVVEFDVAPPRGSGRFEQAVNARIVAAGVQK